VAALTDAAEKHFAAIEAHAMALLRQHFTREETKWSLEKHVVEDGKSADAGWLLARAFNDDAARDDWLHRVPEVSAGRRKEVDLPAAHAYLKGTHAPLADIVAGVHKPATSSGDGAGGCCTVS
jgi:hypothetical protein